MAVWRTKPCSFGLIIPMSCEHFCNINKHPTQSRTSTEICFILSENGAFEDLEFTRERAEGCVTHKQETGLTGALKSNLCNTNIQFPAL